MKCKNVRKLIALHREGELDAGERKSLMAHLAVCDSCKRLFEAYRQNDQTIAVIRSQNSCAENKEMLTSRIMNAVAAIQTNTQQTGTRAIINSFIDLFTLPRTRYISLACIIIIAMFFGGQQYRIYSRVTKLENQLSAAGESYIMKTGDQEMTDCIRLSSRYLSRLKADHGETEKNIRQYFSENPDQINMYLSMLCNRHYKSLRKHFHQDKMIFQPIITFNEQNLP
jgi:hypothetical protein